MSTCPRRRQLPTRYDQINEWPLVGIKYGSSVSCFFHTLLRLDAWAWPWCPALSGSCLCLWTRRGSHSTLSSHISSWLGSLSPGVLSRSCPLPPYPESRSKGMSHPPYLELTYKASQMVAITNNFKLVKYLILLFPLLW